MTNHGPAVILLSGGLDSATTLAVAKRDGFACHTMCFDYGQRHRHEIGAAERLAAAMGVASHRVVRINLRDFGGSALTADIEVPKGGIGHQASGIRTEGNQIPSPGREDATDLSPKGRGAERDGVNARPTGERGNGEQIPVTYVPARNLVFLSLGVALAETVGARDIYIGVNAVDYSGYPDCRPAFVESFERTANLGTKAGVEARARGEGPAVRVRAPLVDLSKAEIIRLGTSLGVDYGLTHSCYDPVAVPGEAAEGTVGGGVVGPVVAACGRCDSCRLRAAGFREAGIADPTVYAAGS